MYIRIFVTQDQVRRENEQVRNSRRRNGEADHYREECCKASTGGKLRDGNCRCHCNGCNYTRHGIDGNGRTISATEASQEPGSSTIKRRNCVGTVGANNPGAAAGSQGKHKSQGDKPAKGLGNRS